MIDPARPEVVMLYINEIQPDQRPVMITGDHKNTALTIASGEIYKEGKV